MAVDITLLLMPTEGILLHTLKEGIQLLMHNEEIQQHFLVNQVLFRELVALALILVVNR